MKISLSASPHSSTMRGTTSPSAGVILFRLGYVSIDVRIEYLQRVLIEHANHLDQFIVVSPQGNRIGSA